MAEERISILGNVQLIGNISNIETIYRYDLIDLNNIPTKDVSELFGGEEDYIEYYVYSNNNDSLISSTYNYLSYRLPPDERLNPGVNVTPNTNNSIQTTNVGIESYLAPSTSSLYPVIEINPFNDLAGNNNSEFTDNFSIPSFLGGDVYSVYYLFSKRIGDSENRDLIIKEISPDRTEIKAVSYALPNEELESLSLKLIDEINTTSEYYVEYIMNFGEGEQHIINNVALSKNPDGYEILFKLYRPLPLEITEKFNFWVVKEKAAPIKFSINVEQGITNPPPPYLRGPNFEIYDGVDKGNIKTQYSSYSTLISNSYNQLNSLFLSQSTDINVDYTDFNDFIFFGSAYRRVLNFYGKVKDIEEYQNYIDQYSSIPNAQPTINQFSSSISDIISSFDGYEYYLYYNSSSYAYPKSGSLKPFSLLSTGSTAAIDWFTTTRLRAEEYDKNNINNLEFTVPPFVGENPENRPYFIFLNMVGHYFDNIWIYLKSITDSNLANNNLDYGISRDLVYYKLKSLGVKLYNSQAGESVADYLLGANTGSSVWNDDFSYTSSYLNNIPRKDLVAELYKRIYHNLPLLLKTKGTVAGLNNLMTVFGIPNRDYYTVYSGSNYETYYTPTGSLLSSSILNVKEFGGSLKKDLIKGYNNDKVRIVNNTITGSVLLSDLSLQTFPITSSEFRDSDLHYVDISFSPQTQIDTYVSSAIASNNPTWSLDDYIGNPSHQYLNTYPDLDEQRKLYFETGVPGFNPFTASLLDYNGFIRLVEIFDNSLFKMLNDFVPERTSLSTGVTINSPVLERNKAAYSIPSANTHSVYDADYDIADISSQYGNFYNALSASNNTQAWYTGDISGSVIDINQYFEDDFNPYDGDWETYNAQNTAFPNRLINLNTFIHSDWNVLLNNVSASVKSQVRQNIEYIGDNILPTSSIYYPAELQDSYLTLRSYNKSRYEGSKLTSLLYNTYTGRYLVQTTTGSVFSTGVLNINL